MGVAANKRELLRFVGDYILQHHAEVLSSLSAGDELYMADPIVVKKVCSTGISDCSDIYSSREEADTRIILHALHADKMFGLKGTKGRIIIKSPDTGVLILAVHFSPPFNTLKSFGSKPDRSQTQGTCSALYQCVTYAIP